MTPRRIQMRASKQAQAHLVRIREQFPWRGGWIYNKDGLQIWVGPEQSLEFKALSRWPNWLKEFPCLTCQNSPLPSR